MLRSLDASNDRVHGNHELRGSFNKFPENTVWSALLPTFQHSRFPKSRFCQMFWNQVSENASIRLFHIKIKCKDIRLTKNGTSPMKFRTGLNPSDLPRDFMAGLVVFFVALPLCLGVALASNAPLLSGLVAGIVGGILVGFLSGSHSSVSGPAAGLTAIVAVQIATLGSFEAFLLAVLIAGLLQIGLGLAKAGSIAAFVPSSVIKGLLTAIGVILIMKQLPHLFGHDPVPTGDREFQEVAEQNPFLELIYVIENLQQGSALIGILSLTLLFLWDKWKPLKRTGLPAPVVVVVLGIGISLAFHRLDGQWAIGPLGGLWVVGPSHLVQVPESGSLSAFFGLLSTPDFSQWLNPAIYVAAVTIAAVASLETLLNLQAVDKLDPRQRTSPPSRELVAQGCGNMVCGLFGGIPITSVVVRGSVNIMAGARSKVSTIIHGVFLLVSVVFLTNLLNMIPLSSLAAILLHTGFKMASPKLVKQMWKDGYNQFAPYMVTVLAIVLTDLLIGVLIGLGVSIAFILRSNVRRPLHLVKEKHLSGEVLRVELAEQVSFLNRAALDQTLDAVPSGGHVLLDATNTHYIDPDLLDLIREYKEKTAPARGVEVSLLGFQDKYQIRDEERYIDYSTPELQDHSTPARVLQFLKDGHERFRIGRTLARDLSHLNDEDIGKHPLAVVVGCTDLYAPAGLIFDLGAGDFYLVRIAGNIPSRKVIGSVEYACAVAGAKLVVVMGHTRCGTVGLAVDHAFSPETLAKFSGCQFLEPIVQEIEHSIDPLAHRDQKQLPADEKQAFIDTVARRNVSHTVEAIQQQSPVLGTLAKEGRIAIIGAMYDVKTRNVEFLDEANVISLVSSPDLDGDGQSSGTDGSGSSSDSNLSAQPLK